MIDNKIIELVKKEYELCHEFTQSVEGVDLLDVLFSMNDNKIVKEIRIVKCEIMKLVPDRILRVFYRSFVKEMISENFEKCQQLKRCIEDLESNNTTIIIK